ncbi:MAG: hypothetical protein UY28_C0004G0066 [Candidatus Amesbacteria bacterium GW2011_GWB1_48_13]|uniref:Recombination endonuclease VII n=1 Tax=Candidatus Amesbacteria bacterium GW2011_GWB1_48_13 TaxID=1618362 RepID=A0A0G1X6T1_9BACT|nr:MAG: hypothetical protein UY28_C0004G0066 [Candidatus Amesbacteria bacterium GW2011_GWB1_48_13]
MLSIKSHCKRGHDISLVGRNHHGDCRPCSRLRKVKYYHLNKEKIKACRKTYREANPEKVRGVRLKREYGITIRQYQSRLAKQNNKCAACGCSGQKLVVDHDHITKQIRDLLCDGCNRGIGQLRDDPIVIRRAARYVESHRQQSLTLRVHHVG